MSSNCFRSWHPGLKLFVEFFCVVFECDPAGVALDFRKRDGLENDGRVRRRKKKPDESFRHVADVKIEIVEVFSDAVVETFAEPRFLPLAERSRFVEIEISLNDWVRHAYQSLRAPLNYANN